MNNLKVLTIAVMMSLATGCSTIKEDIYLKVGAGYKVDQTEIHYRDGSTDHPISARFELGIEDDNITYGISHDSQWFTGWPLNDDMEFQKTEIFIDYKFTFND